MLLVDWDPNLAKAVFVRNLQYEKYKRDGVFLGSKFSFWKVFYEWKETA